MSPQWAVITGGSSGIGAAIFRRLIQNEPNLHCLAVGRRLPQLEETRQQAITSIDGGDNNRVHIVSADVSTPDGISAIVSALPNDACVKYLIHNAGVLGPIGPLMEMDRSAWHQIVATNLDAPLFLTQALLPHLKRCAENSNTTNSDDNNSQMNKARVLHVSSGAAHSSYVGWGPYCVTKSGLHMMYRTLSSELSRHDVLAGSVRPGVVATKMQEDIRAYNGPGEDFPMSGKFHGLYESGKLGRVEDVACYFHWLLSEVGEEEFVKEEWDIRGSQDDERWKKYLAGRK
eukprot:CAMPEP_0196135434 /NCGR_PEP_ID=MMETSP0910-20130528/4072_1 /TAXON_ID=49265 /ORGANISM="Thalassiosira rotula, Strain GSO102" /LENGTH=287 /DNA_ID=CAMNT_0041395573 /DNA_START=41 /DNA_END=904 /DNA_ORIENTATION=-